MASDDEDAQGTRKQLKAMLWYTLGNLTREHADLFDTEVTPQFIAGLVEITWAQLETVGQDLEMFAKCIVSHAGRSTINASDVLLLARRNEGLESILREYNDSLEAEREKRASSKNKQ
ncbi:MHF histone-fold complex component [Microsporum audouinii]